MNNNNLKHFPNHLWSLGTNLKNRSDLLSGPFVKKQELVDVKSGTLFSSGNLSELCT